MAGKTEAKQPVIQGRHQGITQRERHETGRGEGPACQGKPLPSNDKSTKAAAKVPSKPPAKRRAREGCAGRRSVATPPKPAAVKPVVAKPMV